MKRTIEGIVNIGKSNHGSLGQVKQEDDLILKLTLFDNGLEFDATGQVVKIYAQRNNKTILEQSDNITINKNLVIINLKNSFVSLSGLVKFELELKDSSGISTTSDFFLTVNSKIGTAEALEATNEIASLEKLKNDFKSSSDKCIDDFKNNSSKSISYFEGESKVILDNVRKDYESLQHIIINENQAANLQHQINVLRSRTYNALDYGVTGDGITNDQPKLQELINLIHDNGGGILYCPKGTYVLNSQMNWLSNVSLYGDGVGQTIFKTVYNGGTFGLKLSAIGWDTNRKPFAYGTAENPFLNCHFRDFEIDGSGVVSTGGHYSVGIKGMFLQYMINCSVQNIYVHDTIATGIGIDFLDKTFINNVVAKNCGRGYGIMSGGSLGGAGIGIGTGYLQDENLIISNCQAIGCGSNGIFIEHQNLFDSNNQGFDAEGVIITDCIVKDNRNNGIGVRGAKKVIVSNNLLYRNKDGIKVYTLDANDIKIINNISKENTNSDFATDCKLDGLYLENNTFSGRISFKPTVGSKNIYICNNIDIGFIEIPGKSLIDNIVIKNNIFCETDNFAIAFSNLDGQYPLSNLVIEGNVFRQNGVSPGTSNTIASIQLIGSFNKCVVCNNVFEPITTEEAGKMHKNIFITLYGDSNDISVRGNKSSNGNEVTYNLNTRTFKLNNCYFDFIDKVGKLQQIGASNNINDGSFAVIPKNAYKTSLLNMINTNSFELTFGQIPNCHIFHQLGDDNKNWYLSFNNNVFTLSGNGTGTSYSCTFTVDKSYKFYKLSFINDELILKASDDNISFTDFFPNGTLNASNIISSLTVGNGDTIIFGEFKNNAINMARTIRNCTLEQPIIIYKSNTKTINYTNNLIAKYVWNNFGANTDLLDIRSGYNAKVLGNNCLKQIETKQY